MTDDCAMCCIGKTYEHEDGVDCLCICHTELETPIGGDEERVESQITTLKKKRVDLIASGNTPTGEIKKLDDQIEQLESFLAFINS